MTNPAQKFEDISLEDPKIKEILQSSNYTDATGKSYIALPREIIKNQNTGNKHLVFVLQEEETFFRPKRDIKFWLQTIRAISLTATATPGVAVLLYGLTQGWSLHLLYFSLALVGALLLQVAINIWNDVNDHIRLIDLPGTQGGSGILQQGSMNARELNRIAWFSFVLGGLCGLPILFQHPQMMIWISIAAAIGVMGYSGAPFNFKYKALGDLTVFLLCGPLLSIGFALAAFSQFDTSTILLGGYFGLAAMAILHSNNLQDIPVDTKRGAITVASALGFTKARHGLWALYLATWFCAIGMWVLGSVSWIVTLIPLLAIGIVWKISKDAIKASGPESALLAGIRIKTAQTHLMLGLLLCLGLLINIFI